MSEELFFLTITNILLMQVKFQKFLKIFIIKIRRNKFTYEKYFTYS